MRTHICVLAANLHQTRPEGFSGESHHLCTCRRARTCGDAQEPTNEGCRRMRRRAGAQSRQSPQTNQTTRRIVYATPLTCILCYNYDVPSPITPFQKMNILSSDFRVSIGTEALQMSMTTQQPISSPTSFTHHVSIAKLHLLKQET